MGTHGVRPGMTVLYTRPDTRFAKGETFPAIVSRIEGPHVDLCAFTPAPEPAWSVAYAADGKPGTWRCVG